MYNVKNVICVFIILFRRVFMACFLVPTGEAIVTTVVKKVIEHKEKKDPAKVQLTEDSLNKVKFSEKLGWLNKMLWGGSALLCIEHIWHGEVTFIPPFLTALESAEDTSVMLQEMGTVGVSMALLITVVWLGMLAVSKVLENKKAASTSAVKASTETKE